MHSRFLPFCLIFAVSAAALDAAEDRVTSFLEARVAKDPEDFIALNRLAGCYLEQMRSTGDLARLFQARQLVGQSLRAVEESANAGALALKGRVELASHRFADASQTGGQLVAQFPTKSAGREILGDALLELGEYEKARAIFQQWEAQEGSSLSCEARLARLDLIFGRTQEARKRLEKCVVFASKAANPDPATLAWCQVQLGELVFRGGQFEEAENFYNQALAVAPEFFPAQEHLAELLAARGKKPEAIAAYEKLAAKVNRPELFQALGDIYGLGGGHDADARRWLQRAEAAYLKTTETGEVLYFHHLAGFYSDSQPDPGKALLWAQKDLELRKSIFAHDALAWALYQNGRMDEAVAESELALATGSSDAHLHYHRGMILLSAGRVEEGKAALQRALAINPRYNSFHVHR